MLFGEVCAPCTVITDVRINKQSRSLQKGQSGLGVTELIAATR